MEPLVQSAATEAAEKAARATNSLNCIMVSDLANAVVVCKIWTSELLEAIVQAMLPQCGDAEVPSA